MHTQPITLADTPTLLGLYQNSQRYFDIIAAPVPNELDVHSEIESALLDPRRFLELLSPNEHAAPIGYLDLKFDYPNRSDATINLLLIAEDFQSQHWGSKTLTHLEQRLLGRRIPNAPNVKRLLAGIYADNPGAVRFWERHGYHFEIDARPVMSWYAKVLVPTATPLLEVSR